MIPTQSHPALHLLRACRAWRRPAGLALGVAASMLAAPAWATLPCSALVGQTLPASALVLATGGAVVDSATSVTTTSGLPLGVSPAWITYCKVLGRILPAEPVGPDNTVATGGLPIHFQLNLPVAWTQRAMQFGGGGYDGTLVTATGHVAHAAAGDRSPLQRGYATFGSDSGHQAKGYDGRFALRPEALRNFTGDAIKKVRDVAQHLMVLHYGQGPRYAYMQGGSSGGRETLAAIQRWPNDYHGVVSHYPVLQFVGLGLHANDMAKAMYAPGGFVDSAKFNHLNQKVIAACDKLDGLEDGLINNVAACRFDPQVLRCLGNVDWGSSCLTDAQLRTVRATAGDLNLAFPLAQGITRAPGYEVLAGANFGGPADAGWLGLPLDTPTLVLNGYVFTMHNEWLKYFVTGNANYDFRQFNPVTAGGYMARVQQLSAMHDAMSTDLDVFKARGGKVLMLHGTSDTIVTPRISVDYFERLTQRYGSPVLRDFLRFYTVAGFGHGEGRYQMSWSALDLIENWVERGQAPVNPTSTDLLNLFGRSRPLCEYPAFPRYQGGPTHAASSFSCALH
ncbi:tannase/feruloyl esterase family alpha/beta hydrolase [Pseudaquabacterium pictum]|nr:tannase/feruloyl esterase family alpha/beta hydrolase [Rubrivivax pictus]